ncbi:MAG: ribosome-binding factor A [Kofleriaceae bacterium]
MHEPLSGADITPESSFGALVEGDPKTTQLCRQVEEALNEALACSMNPILRNHLHVVRVEPRRRSSSLQVQLSISDIEVGRARDALLRAGGYLRSEVARSIHRRRVPELKFAIVPGDVGEPADGGPHD